jgi:high affinity Mn2+ porin
VDIMPVRIIPKFYSSLGVSLGALIAATSALAADLPSNEGAPEAPAVTSDPWSGFYVGGRLGFAFGHSRWSGAGASGSLNLANHLDSFDESGSFSAGLQAGYNFLLPNRVLLGVEAEATFPAFPDLNGNAIGNATNFVSPSLGAASYGENVLAAASARARIGYVTPMNWLVYATGGVAFARDQLSLSTAATSDSPLLTRVGWTAGAGVEFPVISSWTAKLEYSYSAFGSKNVAFAGNGVTFRSDLQLQELRFGLNYHFGGTDESPKKEATAAGDDRINFHGQATFVDQAYPAMRAPYDGPYSLPGSGMGRETFDLTLYAGLRPWKGAEIWVNPEIDQGFGVGNARGLAGFASGEAYKAGSAWPYARLQRYFLRQTVNLGGETQKVDADINQFAQEQTANRLVFTVGKFAIVDIFDTNKYANNAKGDFLNWATLNAGTFDYAGDAWGFTYGAAAEWYQDRFTVRGGVFDLSTTPAGGADNAASYGLDHNFSQLEFVGELEERHELWTQPGKLKLTGYVAHGRMGEFANAVQVAATTGIDPSQALANDRRYRYKPGVSLNLEQGLTGDLGLFARAGWSDGNVEPWDFTDIDRTAQLGLSLAGKSWGRTNDTVGLAGVVNGLDKSHQAYFAAGGLGILVGDGQLKYGAEKILEAYYNYALTPSTKIGFDYQFIANPAYNTERGPANLFAGRVHWQF